ncbi:hypothetical protein [Roseovarius carneus]|uniref:hypothetical protein n=1 Tax=Roseovarius carneus TaxID=2853164 RepID=UPI001CCBB9ED|nr:hypothetical protein [Roseovarius carneus]
MFAHRKLTRLAALCCGLALVSACTNANDLDSAPVPLGDFALGHNVVVAPNLTKGPASRDATEEEWAASVKAAIDERFSRYQGARLYHLGISVEGYVLAVPGIPLVASPKSALIVNVTAWDDAAGKKLNEKPEQITIVETISGSTMISSGLTQSKEVQMENLSRNAAKLIQNWLVRENLDKEWFGGAEANKAVLRAQRAAQAQVDAEAEAAVAAEEATDAAADGATEATDASADVVATGAAAQAASVQSTLIVTEPDVVLAPES